MDAAIERVLRFQERTQAAYEAHEINFEKHHAIALEASRKSITLLKNEHGALPLRTGLKQILVVGQREAAPFIGGDGSSRVNRPPYHTTPLEELRALLGPTVAVDFMGQDELRTFENEVGHMETELRRRAQAADAVVVFLCQDYSENSETMDRNHMQIEPYYEHILRVCDRVSQRVIAVLNVGGAVLTQGWQHYADAILVSWLGGQGMGRAVAETLCGKNNPSGKLAETFPKREQDVLSLENYPGDGRKVLYKEGLMVGYRHFDTNEVGPAYEFGFGLSYTEFAYRDLRRTGRSFCFTLQNTGAVKGDEIVQVYVCAPNDAWMSHPEKELKAFQRISLCPGESKIVEFTLEDGDFQYYNPALKKWITETGVYTVRVGSSSRRLPLECAIALETPERVTVEASPE